MNSIPPLRLDLPDLTMFAYLVAFVGGAMFIVEYWRTDWWHHPWGRHVMAFTVNLEALFAVALAGRVFGRYPGREIALLLLSCVLAGTVWWRYALLRRGKREDLQRGPGRHQDPGDARQSQPAEPTPEA